MNKYLRCTLYFVPLVGLIFFFVDMILGNWKTPDNGFQFEGPFSDDMVYCIMIHIPTMVFYGSAYNFSVKVFSKLV